MNWSRIKTILIFILIATNILLLVDLLITINSSANEPGRNLDKILELYRLHGIELRAELPKQFDNLPGVNAQVLEITNSTEQKAMDYFINMGRIFDFSAYPTSIYSVAREVKGDRKKAEPPENAEELLTLAKELLDRFGIGYDVADYDFSRVGRFIILSLYQYVSVDSPDYLDSEPELFRDAESSIEIYFDKKSIVGLHIIKVLEHGKPSQRRYDIIRVEEALYRALEQAPSDTALVGISIVYKLNDDSLLAENLIRGEMLPYYELRFENTETIYVRAVKQ